MTAADLALRDHSSVSSSHHRTSGPPSSHGWQVPAPSVRGAGSPNTPDLAWYISGTAEEIGRISSAAVDSCGKLPAPEGSYRTVGDQWQE